MGRKEKRLEEDTLQKIKENEVYEIIRTVLFFICLIIAIISIVLTNWLSLGLSIIAAFLSIPFKFILKVFPNNIKLNALLFPQQSNSNEDVKDIDEHESENVFSKIKKRKESLNNRKVAKEEINRKYSNISSIRLFSIIFAGAFLLASFSMFFPENKKQSNNSNSIVETTAPTNNITTETTTDISTTEKMIKKEIHLSPNQEVFYLYLDDINEENTFGLERDDDSDELDKDLIIEPIISDSSIVSVEIKKSSYDYTVFLTPKKAGTTDLTFTSNKDNYIFGSIKIVVNNPETTQKDNSRTVYVTPSGECYHFDSNCGGKNSYSITLNEAKNRGYRSCEKCT